MKIYRYFLWILTNVRFFFLILNIHKPSIPRIMKGPTKKFSHDQFSHFYVFWIQTSKVYIYWSKMFSLDLLRSLSLRSLKNLNLDSVLRVLLEIISVRHTSDRNWNLELIQWWKYPSELFLIQLESPCPVYLYFVYLVFLVL